MRNLVMRDEGRVKREEGRVTRDEGRGNGIKNLPAIRTVSSDHDERGKFFPLKWGEEGRQFDITY